MQANKKWILAGGCGILLLVLLLIIGIICIPKQQKIVYYFYEEACGGCDPDGAFYALFRDRLQGAALPEEVHIYCYNQFTEDGTLWQGMCDKLNIPEQERKLPMVIAGEQFATGEENIYNQLRTMTCALYEVPDTGTIWYYYRPDCKDCIRIEALVEEAFAENPALSVIRIDTTETKPKEAFKEKLRSRKIPQEEWQVHKAVGTILDALEAKGYTQENTLFVFAADHGDSMAARGQVTKQVSLYEETTRVPLIFKGPGVRPGRKEGITSLLDIFPTLCSWAGITPPEGLQGRDLAPALSGGCLPKREYIASEWHTEWGYTVSPGRMIRTERYKYTRYIEDGGEELFDLLEDSLEQKNLVCDSGSATVLSKMRGLLQQHLAITEDSFETLSWKADRRWRGHPAGYQNHRGIAAPMVDETEK